jgi:hypothetical protein
MVATAVRALRAVLNAGALAGVYLQGSVLKDPAMRSCILWIVLCLLLPQAGSAPAAAATGVAEDRAETAMRAALADALQARGTAALMALRSLDATQLSARDSATRACMLQRLGARRPPAVNLPDPFVAGVLASYQEYWWRSLLAEQPPARNEAWLLAALNRRVASAGTRAAANMEQLESALEPVLLAHGYHALLGMTRPLHELMLWRSEVQTRYQVSLPEGEQPVVVVFMDDFATLGWAGFATCDRHHSGGWTKPEGLYAVRSAYDLDSEEFRVSYLAHEAQHFADGERFPKLDDQAQLEYRAKLTELATARTSAYELLDAFAANTSEDPSVPHSFANGRLVHDMARRVLPAGNRSGAWTDVPVATINAAAAALLREDTARLERTAGA